ncbi:hypothetical protein DL770_004820 [Monosporascus sp. CRB-9-2]|nr:hypothetical protein DL770_004820 [Monosporascus sp. CRB-9-2]
MGFQALHGGPRHRDHQDVRVRREQGVIPPDGFRKSVLLVNEQFPGPLVKADWGYWAEVTVNYLLLADDPGYPAEGDRHPLARCPIAPGGGFTCPFRAEIYGTSWYHSHYSAQHSGGLFEPMVVHGPNNVDYGVDIGSTVDYSTVAEEVMPPGFQGRTYSDNNPINGRMNFNCAKAAAARTAEVGNNGNTATTNNSTTTTTRPDNAGLSKFRFQSGKRHRLRFINSGSEGVQRVSLDGHAMTVMAQDFVKVELYETHVVKLGPLALAAVYYDDADDTDALPTTPPDARARSEYVDAGGGAGELHPRGGSDSIAALADNPPRRNVRNVQPFGHFVVQMDVSNLDLWPFRCFIAWHASAGFFSQMLLLPDEVTAASS